MKHLLLTAATLLTISATAENKKEIAQVNDTIVTINTTVTEINSSTNDTIVRTTVTEEIRRTVPAKEDNYIIDEDNNRVSFFWDLGKKNKNKKRLDAHWSGFGVGFINYSDKDIPYGGAKASSSLNFTFNFLSVSKQLGQSNFLVYTGLGTEWAKYKFNDNAALTEVDGVTRFVPAAEGIEYTSSKLTVYHISVPLMLEFQSQSFHASAGAICLFKWRSKSQTEHYQDVEGHRIKHKNTQGRDLNISPVNLRLKAQVGINHLALFATYDPISMFANNKGPKLHSYVFGGMLCF